MNIRITNLFGPLRYIDLLNACPTAPPGSLLSHLGIRWESCKLCSNLTAISEL